MKIAVTSERGEVFQHFGRTPEFAIFEVESGRIVSEGLLKSGDSGHGALAGLLSENKVDTLICGGIGGGAINALSALGIRVIGGASGKVGEVAKAFADGTLSANSNFACNHHYEGNGCGEHHHDSNHKCHCS